MKGYGRELLLGIASLDGKCGNVEIDEDDEYVNKRWPTRVFYGKDGELKHPYTRMEKPNLNLMSCRYRCKSYRTFKCSARLDIVEDKTTPGMDIKHGWGEHSELCQKKNGIKPKDYVEENNSAGTKLRDRTEEFKARLGELAVDKIWLPPMKIWSMARDEFVAADEDALVTVPCSDV